MGIVETIEFTVDNDIIHSLISRQAGTLAKALLEAIMNSIDAGSTRVSVQLGATGFSVSDDGRGFRSAEEIKTWFAVFGKRHTPGDATYGEFRMGRGQLMDWGITNWSSSSYSWKVDIRNRGLRFDLEHKKRAVTGCRITGKLYEVLEASQLEEARAELAHMAKYSQIPVSLNGRIISKRPDECVWDYQTDDAYIKFNRSSEVELYNLGVFVRNYSAHTVGSGGIIVSKRPLKVNFPRNDVLVQQCEVWPRIIEQARALSIQRLTDKDNINKEERQFLADQMIYGRIPSSVEATKLRVFTDARGSHLSLEDLRRFKRLSVAAEGRRQVGARLQTGNDVLVLADETLKRFRTDSLSGLLERVRYGTGQALALDLVDFGELVFRIDDRFREISDPAIMSAEERAAFEALCETHQAFFEWFSGAEKTTGARQLKVGDYELEPAWTDGRSYITVTRKLLKKAAIQKMPGFLEAFIVLTHAYCHDSPDALAHDHDPVFYSKFHDTLQYRPGRLAKLAVQAAERYERKTQMQGLLV
jgi:hypothetical protein